MSPHTPDALVMPFSRPTPKSVLKLLLPTRPGLRVGLDTVDIADVARAWQHFGLRYARRLFTDAECQYALAEPALTPQRLAARFAAKEAVIKALNLCEVGVDWRDIEVLRQPDGSCRLALHGRAAQAFDQLPVCDAALSLSHDNTHACAVVVLLPQAAPSHRHPDPPPAWPAEHD